MPGEPRERSWWVISFWVSLFVLIGVAFFSAIAAIVWRQGIMNLGNDWGIYASVVGCGIGLVGFSLTIVTLLLTAQAEKDAARKAQDATQKAELAIQEANKRMTVAVERLAMMVLENSCNALGRGVKSIEASVTQAIVTTDEVEWRRHWKDCAEKCRAGIDSINDMLDIDILKPDEHQALRKAAEGLLQLALFVERNRLPPDAKNGKLPADGRGETLGKLLLILADVRHRVRHQVYEAPHESSA